MKLIPILKSIIEEQENTIRKTEVDITIFNGNILLRSFHIYDIDIKRQIIKGLTAQEEYAYVREGREPVFCYLKFDEVKELVVPELGIEYSQMAMAGY